jgi:hypothetical protein
LTYFRSSLSDEQEAIEFLVETDGEVPVRDYGPALFVGGVEINQSERVDPTTWRFLAYNTEPLKRNAAISWGWMKDPKPARQRTKYRFVIE